MSITFFDRLEIINFNNFNLSDSGVESFVKGRYNAIKTLNMVNCGIGPAGVKSMFYNYNNDSIKHSNNWNTLEILNLNSNIIADEGAIYIFKALNSSNSGNNNHKNYKLRKLKELYLCNNKITSEVINYNYSSESINIFQNKSDNISSNSTTIKNINNLKFPNKIILTHLHLDRNPIKNSHQPLPLNILNISLSYCKLNTSDILYLFPSISFNKIHHFKLNNNNLCPNIIPHLSNYQLSLQYLNLNSNNIQAEGAKYFSKITFYSLSELYLSNNQKN